MEEVRKIEVCVRNLPLGSQRVWEETAGRFPQVRLRRWACLGLCEICVRRPFVLINDQEVLQAQDAETLWEVVRRRIEAGVQLP
ncbi:DUF1450 domain-containing protein [Alicyclobacillus macrosporangiidus]|uniref:Uncharacterized protein YuzB, UPF0349 family n=1 Tax=Alicyclobacillus macrosporangiidus TaxID=392015 RepID=A0A1I7KJF8_9BACL|nr:DUF1450 domain-containing protein [Alicyclobacillus macrosporangiidus]SFU97575.1 Uncharacterized protein YuzB, UPF0349 family [Alicyclobacillus macrosporangiidus]